MRCRRHGSSTRLPSVKLDLGTYVITRPRADGTTRVLFEVPPRLRPRGWLPTIPLPRAGPWTGDLADASEVAAIQADAKSLYAELQAARGIKTADPNDRSLERLKDLWLASDAVAPKRPRTREDYAWKAGEILATYRALPKPYSIVTMDGEEARRFLAVYDDRPSLRWSVRKVFRLMMKHAIRLKWRADNPFDGIEMSQPEASVGIWEQEDVDLAVWACGLAGQHGIAAVILTEWEIGQRLTDAILFRSTGAGANAAEYSAAEGVFRFWQSKTASYVTIPVSERLRAVLAAIRVEGSLYLYHDASTGLPFPDVGRLGHLFGDIRDALILPAGGRHLRLRHLRHSCVVQLARAGCTVPEIASITGHSLATVESILSRYLPRDNVVAWNAQKKRGLITAGLGQ
jgi:hypothetical protein